MSTPSTALALASSPVSCSPPPESLIPRYPPRVFAIPSIPGATKLRFRSPIHERRGLWGDLELAGVEMGSGVPVGCRGVVLPASEEHVEGAVGAVRAGRVVAVPTDTLYGFACDACSSEAVNNIYEIKGRKYTSPLAICVADISDISRYATVDHLPSGLLESLLPGPVTVVLPRGESSILDKSLNPGLDSIGVRVPDYDFIRAIARGSGSALALTSANLSGEISSVSINDFEDLWHHCAYVYDGGLLPSGRAGSTVVNLIEPKTFKILRPGSAQEETITILRKFKLAEAS